MPKYNWVNDTGLIRDARADLGDTRSMQPLRALDLNGTNQYGYIQVDQVEYPFSIFCWADTDSSSSLWLLNISDPSNASKYFCLGFDDGNLVLIGRRNTTEIANSQAVPLVTDWFSCIAVFQDSTTVVIYRNGTLLHTFSGLTSVSAGIGFTRFAFGTYRTSSPGVYWNGRVKNCGFLRRAATLSDAQEFHANGIIHDAEVLLPLEDNSTTVAYNIGRSASWWLNEPRRNLLSYPNDFSNSAWAKFNNGTGSLPAVTANQAENPVDGDIDADLVVFALNGGTTSSDVSQIWRGSDAALPSSQRAWSIYARTSDGSTVILNLLGADGNGTAITITPVWQRFTRMGTGVENPRLRSKGSEGTSDYASVYLWGAQYEIGSTATAYQPVLGSGIEQPEATLVNAPASYVGRDVPFSISNKYGYSTRKNLIQYSNNITSGWVSLNITPTFFNNYSIIRETSATGEHRSYSSPPGRVIGQLQTINIWVKPEGRDIILVRDSANGTYRVQFNLSTQSVSIISSATGTNLTASIVEDDYYGSGVYRCTINFTGVGEPPATNSGRTIMINLANSVASISYTGDTSLGVTIFNVEYQDGDVDPAYQYIGISPGINALFPALLANTTKSAARDNLAYRGVCPNNAQLLQSACFNFDGVDDYISIPSLTGSETVLSKQGTSSLTISSGRIDGTAGTLYNLKLSNGMYLPCSEGGGSQLHCVNTNQAFSIVNGQEDNWLETQDDYHYNILEGFSYKDELLYDNETLYYDGVILTYAD